MTANERDIPGVIAPPPARLYEFDAATSGPIRQNLDLDAYAPANGATVSGTVALNAIAGLAFGWTRDEALGRPLADTIIPAEHREAHDRGLARVLGTAAA